MKKIPEWEINFKRHVFNNAPIRSSTLDAKFDDNTGNIILSQKSKPVKTMKSIKDLTDDQLIEIARLAFGDGYKTPIIVTYTPFEHPKFKKWRGVIIAATDPEFPEATFANPETLRIWENLDVDFIQDWDGGRGVSNQYKIFQLLQQWEIKPI